ncbi:nodulation protein NolB [Bradyrhizobium sp. Cp5.3]|uniref:nodulation protein NolB n=1 Tax=Bradyrhizobium sp. Cp5.3 TaxID=443598 RepID=UPI000409722E|nr:nodulation protein NolB [Bradyrhizobium sp. Cp5.3]
MMFGVTPISTNAAECLSNACSSAQVKFQESLASVTQSAAPTVSEVERAVAHTGPLGDRVLQNLSAVHKGKPFAAGAVPSQVGREPGSPNLLPGPAAQPILRLPEVEVHPIGGPDGLDHFETALANLQNVYEGVILVSLISKSASAVGSSMNKLMSAG